MKKETLARSLFFAALSLFCSSYTFCLFCKKQGIEGYVYLVTGNQMPSPDIKKAPPKGVKTTLYIYELTNLQQVTRVGQSGLYSAIHTKLVKTVTTDKNGHFKVKLPPGRYSLFTKDDTMFYANWFDGGNNIAPTEVTAKKWTTVEVKMDSKAVY
ncbi:MAG: hypothetical protein QM731_12860 [Chitinophagaceae bacterium]